MGTRHWPEDADLEIEKLENTVATLRAACSMALEAMRDGNYNTRTATAYEEAIAKLREVLND